MINTRAVTAAEIQELDRKAIEAYGIPSLILMENAGRAVAAAVLRQLDMPSGAAVGVICGAGHNAGDGLVAARHLWNAGADVSLILLRPPESLKNDAAVNFGILQRCGYPFSVVESWGAAHGAILRKQEVLVDAVFGVGLARPVEGVFAAAVNAMNRSGRPVIAADVPSGLDATTGEVRGVAVKAAATVTFTFAKSGFGQAAGPDHCGRVEVVDIGIPKKLILTY